MRQLQAALATIALVLSGCGGGAAAEPEATGDEGTSGSEQMAAAIPSPPEEWATMTHEARADWMMAEVLPRMQEQFASYDGERYADSGCRTCHGPNGRETGFAMPCMSLPALPATGTPEQRQMVRDYPEGTRFMFNHVMPTMQALLGAPEFDHETGQGFSCFSCHPHAGDEGSTLIRLSAPAADSETSAADPSAANPSDGGTAEEG